MYDKEIWLLCLWYRIAPGYHQEKAISFNGTIFTAYRQVLELTYVLCNKSSIAFFNLEVHFVTFSKAFKPRHIN